MARKQKADGDHLRNANPRFRASAKPRTSLQPKLRLMEVRPMATAKQQRFEMLFDALIAHWLARNENKGGENDD